MTKDDLISRAAAIDALAKFVPYAICDESTESYTNGLTDAYNLILQLPSAQPEPCEDAVSRAEIIRLILERGLYCDTQADRETSAEIIRQLPPAQPKPEQNTRSERTESDKLGVKMGETCTDTISRQAAIYVASGFCHPANIAKELAKLPSAQPQYEELTPEEAASEIASGSTMTAWYWLDDMIRLKQMGYAICRKK